MPTIQPRHWWFVINNPGNFRPEFAEDEMDCLLYGLEIGENGTPHLQGALFMRPGFELCKTEINYRYLGGWASMGKQLGTPEENAKYCSKDYINDEFWFYGILPEPISQGQRIDLSVLTSRIQTGTTVNDIVMMNPVAFHQYGRTLERIEQIVNSKIARNWIPEVYWFWGPTGTGKTRAVYDECKEPYIWQLDDHNWQDNYTNQEYVIIDDFRGQIPYSQLLRMLDRYPYTVSRRGRAPQPFLAKKIWITSSRKPEDCYSNLSRDDSIAQLLRRITQIKQFGSIDETADIG